MHIVPQPEVFRYLFFFFLREGEMLQLKRGTFARTLCDSAIEIYQVCKSDARVIIMSTFPKKYI